MLILLYHALLLLIAIFTYQHMPSIFGQILVVLLTLYLLPVAVSAILLKYHPLMLIEPFIFVIAFMIWFAIHNHGQTPVDVHNWVTCYAADGVTTNYYGPPANAPMPCGVGLKPA